MSRPTARSLARALGYAAAMRKTLVGLTSLWLAIGACKADSASEAEAGSKVDPPDDPSKKDAAEQMVEDLRLDERSFPLLIWSIHTVSQDYYDKTRFDPRGQLLAATDRLGLHTPEFFAVPDASDPGQLEVTVRDQSKRFAIGELKGLDPAADRLEEILEFTASVLSLEAEPLHELEYAAINGFLSPLDPHTILLTPEESAELGVKTRGSFGGIGAEIVARDRRILVVRVIPESPAAKAGLQDNDVILAIDDQSTVNMSSADAQGLLRGPIDTQVVLEVRRGDAVVRVEITRGQIAIPTVIAEMLPNDVGYLQVATFQEDTAEKLLAALQDFQSNAQLAGLVVDLRGNSGGLLAQAVGILNQFVKGGELVIVRSALGREHQDATEEIVVPMKVPVVTLVDESSASASEIVGGSMKHLDRGVILGRASFGKGTVQELRNATPYGRPLALKLTIAEYRVAGDRKIQNIGVIPDVELLPVELLEYEGVARYYDLERFERQRQRGRTAHLPSAVHDAHIEAELALAKSPLMLRYLSYSPQLAQEALQASGGDAASRTLRDPEIRLARDVALKLVGKEGRRAQVDALPAIVEELSKREGEAIRAGIETWKVDWADVGPVDAPLEVAVNIVDTKNGELHRAGEAFTLHVEVRNPGTETLEQVHLITDCARDELDGIELLIGALPPGESTSRDIELQVLPWYPDFVDTLTVAAHVGEPEATPDGEASVAFTMLGAERPRFSFDYWIIDDPHLVAEGPARPEHEPWPGEVPFVVQGNGDGLLQPGEHVLLAFRAHNAGGPAPDARVLLRNLSGTQGLLEEGLVVHGALAQGEEFTGAFGVSIAPTADPSQPLELELIVGDGVLRESVDDKLRFRIVPGRDAVSDAHSGRYKVGGDEPVRLYNGADSSAPVVAELPAGTLLEVVGSSGDWRALAGPKGQGRRLWVPADLLEAASGGKARAALDPKAGRMVDPPHIVLADDAGEDGDDGAPVVETERVTIAGVAEHPERVRDVMVTVRAAGPAQPERKVFYLANRAVDGDAAKRLEFSAEVPLSPGSNRVTIIVRDQDKVMRQRDLRVFRR